MTDDWYALCGYTTRHPAAAGAALAGMADDLHALWGYTTVTGAPAAGRGLEERGIAAAGEIAAAYRALAAA